MTAVFGITGWSGGGKTTLITRLIPILTARGFVVGVLKHAHHGFAIDREGKDSRRFRDAGCREVAVSSARRWAFMHEHEPGAAETGVAALLDKFTPECNLILVEGYKNAPLPKVEVWRRELARPPLAVDFPKVEAVAADFPPPGLPSRCAVLPLNDAAAVADFVVRRAR
ncbi:MAG: molybdopterin-guanine dinucleotide biosynthesis protein B [Gammaproteobacteria bacterium]